MPDRLELVALENRMPIPPAITREDVLEALEMLDRGESADFGPPTRYEVLHAGKRYPPKAAIGFA